MISTCLYFRGTLPIPEKKWKLTLHEYTIDRVGYTSEIMKNKVTFLEKYAQANKPTKRFVTWHQLQLDDKSLIAIPRSTDASLPRLAAKCLTPHLKRQMATSEIIAAIGDQSKLKTIKYCWTEREARKHLCERSLLVLVLLVIRWKRVAKCLFVVLATVIFSNRS